MTFGSGFNAEDTSDENLERLKILADYAHTKGIVLGGYSLLASRRVGGGNDVVMPEGMSPRFGNSPCLESEWGHNYFEKLYNLYEKTGLDILEHDGTYPGDVCASTEHPGHKIRCVKGSCRYMAVNMHNWRFPVGVGDIRNVKLEQFDVAKSFSKVSNLYSLIHITLKVSDLYITDFHRKSNPETAKAATFLLSNGQENIINTNSVQKKKPEFLIQNGDINELSVNRWFAFHP